MKPTKIQDRADYPCKNCHVICQPLNCKSWQDCFKRSWKETIDYIKGGYIDERSGER